MTNSHEFSHARASEEEAHNKSVALLCLSESLACVFILTCPKGSQIEQVGVAVLGVLDLCWETPTVPELGFGIGKLVWNRPCLAPPLTAGFVGCWGCYQTLVMSYPVRCGLIPALIDILPLSSQATPSSSPMLPTEYLKKKFILS